MRQPFQPGAAIIPLVRETKETGACGSFGGFARRQQSIVGVTNAHVLCTKNELSQLRSGNRSALQIVDVFHPMSQQLLIGSRDQLEYGSVLVREGDGDHDTTYRVDAGVILLSDMY